MWGLSQLTDRYSNECVFKLQSTDQQKVSLSYLQKDYKGYKRT